MLFVQLAGVLLYPWMEASPRGRALFAAFGLLVLAVALRVVRRSPWLTWIGILLAVLVVLLSLVAAIKPSPSLAFAIAALEAAFYFYAAGSLTAYMLQDWVATTDELFAAGATFTLLAWAFARWMAKSGRSPLTVRDVGDMMFTVILGVLIGGRLGYALLYEPHVLTDFSSRFPFWGLLAINKGGMASHGGIIGVIIALMIFGKRRGLSVLHMLDIGSLASTIGLARLISANSAN